MLLLSWCFRQSTAMIRSLHAHHASCCDVVLVMSGVWSDFGQGIHSCFLMFSGVHVLWSLNVAQTGRELLRRSWNFAGGQAFCHSKQIMKTSRVRTSCDTLTKSYTFYWCFLTQLHHKISGKCQSVERRLRLQQLQRWALKRLEWPQTFAQFGTYVKSDMFGSLWT